MRSIPASTGASGRKKSDGNGPDLSVLEVDLMVLVSVGLPMPRMAVLATVEFQKKNGRGLRNCRYCKSPVVSFEML